MKLDDHGLPLPGRELDAAVWEMLPAHYPVQKRLTGIVDGKPSTDLSSVYYVTAEDEIASGRARWDWWYQDKVDWNKWYIVPKVSTTHAFFQVVEAMEAETYAEWEFYDWGKGLNVILFPEGTGGEGSHFVQLVFADYPDREHAYAHAVCACAWKAKGGEK